MEKGSNVCVLDTDAKPVRRIILDRRVNSIQIDREGRLVAYQERDNGGFFIFMTNRICGTSVRDFFAGKGKFCKC